MAREGWDGIEAARYFVANAPVYMTLMGLDGRILELSRPFLAAFFADGTLIRPELDDRSPEPVVAGASARRIRERLAAGEAMVSAAHRLTAVDGTTRALQSEASYWRNRAGVPLAILFVHKDVTAEIAAEAARENTSKQLRTVLDQLPAQIVLFDLDAGTVDYANSRALSETAKVLNWKPGASFREQMDSERLGKMDYYNARAGVNGGTFHVDVVVADGSLAGRTVRTTHMLFQDARGRRQLLWMSEDVTALQEASEALRRAAAEAEAANRAKSEFLANMSHEIRTPLNGVMGVAGALAKTSLSAAQVEMVSLIENSAKTLETLLSDILDLARIEAGKLEIQPEPFELAASVDACIALFDAAAQAKGLDLSVEVAADALETYVGDAARIRQILSNLLSNAVKFTQDGQIRLKVDARRGETISELRFEVSDTGIGFDAETKARLFSRFEQADGSITRRFGGSGLGLAISRSLAEAMGGRLEAASTPGEGAVFALTLELSRAAGASEARTDSADPGAARDPLEGMRVLLAEDHPINRRVVELILGAAGVDLTCVENGAEAVEAFRAEAFDLILMDMQMPVMDGLTAIREIRKLEAGGCVDPTPIYVLTGNAMPDHVGASTRAGADGHLSKPILADALLASVAEAAKAKSPPADRRRRLA